MVFNTVFNSISFISRLPVHLSMLSWNSFNQYSAQYSFQATGRFYYITVVKTTNSAEKGMIPVPMTIINPWKEYWLSRGLNQRPPVLKSAMLPTELWGSDLEKNVEKGENAGYQHFLLFPTFSILLMTNLTITAKINNVSYPNLLKLEQSKIL